MSAPNEISFNKSMLIERLRGLHIDENYTKIVSIAEDLKDSILKGSSITFEEIELYGIIIESMIKLKEFEFLKDYLNYFFINYDDEIDNRVSLIYTMAITYSMEQNRFLPVPYLCSMYKIKGGANIDVINNLDMFKAAAYYGVHRSLSSKTSVLLFIIIIASAIDLYIFSFMPFLLSLLVIVALIITLSFYIILWIFGGLLKSLGIRALAKLSALKYSSNSKDLF